MDQLGQPDAGKAVVIYHDHCMDGFAAAWAFHILKEKDYGHEQVEYIPMSYGENPTQRTSFAGKDCYIVDFSFDRATLTDLSYLCAKVIVLDHHKTAAEALLNWEDKPDNLHIVFDMDRSGAGITWDWFGYENNNPLAKKPRPRLISYVEDRDLWRFNLPWSKEINAVLAVTDKEFKDYTGANSALELALMNVAQTGGYLTKQFDKLCKEISDDARPIKIFSGPDEFVEGLCVNCSPQFSSEVGNLLAIKTGTFGSTYHSTKTGGVKWSLRSKGDFDVSAIAKNFLGGGHKNAAGFTLTDIGESTNAEVRLWALEGDKNA